MSSIWKKRVLQKNRKLISNFFQSSNDDASNQKTLMDSTSFFYLQYYYNLSLNSKREEFQILTGRTENSNTETDDFRPNNFDNQPPSSARETKQKKSKNESPYYDFNNAYFSKFGRISKNFSKFGHIAYLSLQNCCLCTIPKQLYSLPKELISLDLSNNFISKIPLNVSWKKLKHLNLSGNLLREWPSIFEHEKFEALDYLNIGRNLIEKINPNQPPFHNLKTFILSNNYLTEFPIWIKDCSELRILNICQNSHIPNFDLTYLCMMPNLKILNISSVRVNKIPLKMQDSLQILIISKDLVDSLPSGDYQLLC